MERAKDAYSFPIKINGRDIYTFIDEVADADAEIKWLFQIST